MPFSSSVTTVKPETVSVYQVKKTDKDTYKKKASWRLRDLKIVDGKDGAKVCNIVNHFCSTIMCNCQYIQSLN